MKNPVLESAARAAAYAIVGAKFRKDEAIAEYPSEDCRTCIRRICGDLTEDIALSVRSAIRGVRPGTSAELLRYHADELMRIMLDLSGRDDPLARALDAEVFGEHEIEHTLSKVGLLAETEIEGEWKGYAGGAYAGPETMAEREAAE